MTIRSRSARWIGGAALATAVACGAGMAYGSSNAKHDIPPLHAHQTSEVQLARGSGDSPVGSEFIDTWSLDDNGHSEGTLSTTCQVVSSSDAGSTAQCSATARLTDGDITVQGLVDISQAGPSDIELAITGGTAGYRTARGVVRVHPVDETNELVTFELAK